MQVADATGATNSAAFVLAITAGCPLQTATGHLDSSFGTGGKVTTGFADAAAFAGAVVVQANGKLVTAGHRSSSSGADFALARYAPDGTLDPSFGSGGTVTTDLGGDSAGVNALVVQANGKLVAAGYTSTDSSFDFALARYNPDGTLDASFGIGGKVTTDLGSNDQAQALVLEPDGRLVAGGFLASSSGFDFALARYNPDGTLDPSFGIDGKVTADLGSNDQIHGLVLQADGKLVAGGISGTATSAGDFVLARYNPDGTLDTSFGTDGKTLTDFAGNNDQGRNLLMQPDGKFVVAGTSFGLFSSDFALARYNPDGTLDATFSADGKVTTDFCDSLDIPPALALQADGKLVAGGFTSANSTTDFALARYNPDGTLDGSFGADGKLTTDFADSFDLLLALVVQADGKLVAAGSTQDATTGTERFALARYLTQQ